MEKISEGSYAKMLPKDKKKNECKCQINTFWK